MSVLSGAGAVRGGELLVESGEMQEAESLFSVPGHPSVLQEVIQRYCSERRERITHTVAAS